MIKYILVSLFSLGLYCNGIEAFSFSTFGKSMVNQWPGKLDVKTVTEGSQYVLLAYGDILNGNDCLLKKQIDILYHENRTLFGRIMRGLPSSIALYATSSAVKLPADKQHDLLDVAHELHVKSGLILEHYNNVNGSSSESSINVNVNTQLALQTLQAYDILGPDHLGSTLKSICLFPRSNEDLKKTIELLNIIVSDENANHHSDDVNSSQYLTLFKVIEYYIDLRRKIEDENSGLYGIINTSSTSDLVDELLQIKAELQKIIDSKQP